MEAADATAGGVVLRIRRGRASLAHGSVSSTLSPSVVRRSPLLCHLIDDTVSDDVKVPLPLSMPALQALQSCIQTQLSTNQEQKKQARNRAFQDVNNMFALVVWHRISLLSFDQSWSFKGQSGLQHIHCILSYREMQQLATSI